MDIETEEAVRAAIGRAAEESQGFSAERLRELGWDDLLAEDTEAAVRVLFEEHGHHLLASPALDSVVHVAIAGPWKWTAARVAYPRPGSDVALCPDSSEIDGLLLAGLDNEAEYVLAPLATSNGVRLHSIPAANAKTVRVDGIDPTQELWRVTADPSYASDVHNANGWEVGLAAARRALAHELNGLTRHVLRVVIEHVSTREQFGRPLGANQVVQHRLADAQVDLASAEVIARESAVTPTPTASVAAKAAASQAFETIAAHGQQVLGAIGYTWEHQWHHYLRRGMTLSALLGGIDDCEEETGRKILQSGVPRLGALG